MNKFELSKLQQPSLRRDPLLLWVLPPGAPSSSLCEDLGKIPVCFRQGRRKEGILKSTRTIKKILFIYLAMPCLSFGMQGL